MTYSLAVRLAFCLLAWSGSAAAQEAAETAPVAPAPPIPTIALTAPPEGCARPEYPLASLRYDEQGTVTLGFLISPEGVVQESKIFRSSGYRGLDEAARVAIGKCRFKPAMEDGKAITSWARVQYVWRLN